MSEYDDLCRMRTGTIVRFWQERGYFCRIMRSTVSLTAYIGVPSWHMYYDKKYDDVSIDCHGGLTFAGKFNDDPEDRWWLGWDYGHGGDKTLMPYEILSNPMILSQYREIHNHNGEKEWTISEVEKEIDEVISNLPDISSQESFHEESRLSRVIE